MPYFVMQIQTGMEEKYLRVTRLINFENKLEVLWPRRTLRIRKSGKWKNSQHSIFPGYLFIEADDVYPVLFTHLKRIKGFIRFLKSNHLILPLSGEDCDILKHFLSFGEVVGKSLVTFDENERIIIKSGPLKGLEGNIIKVNRRKKRVKVKLRLYENSFLIDLGFESIETALSRSKSTIAP